ncbi:MAG: radical SAM family heme chaperone HemW [Actinomycetota bacterium]|nr:radical SAM family heme chaperone HemW [Actinomycetota bacterium]
MVAPVDPPQPFGLYVHVPFCAARCDYCSFATWTDRHHLVEAYLEACVLDADRLVAAGMPAVTSVFVGGGTPTLVPGAALVEVLARVPRSPDCEVTVECNPDDVTADLLATYRAGGVNRLSFGVQSTSAHVLQALGRTHDRDNVARCVDLARAAGFATFNLDVIYGGAGESLDDWCRTLDDVVALDPPHVSAYALTVEAGTPLAADASRHPDDDDQADKYLAAVERLGGAGYESYEISNWAKPGHECRHNALYWSMGEYQGLGCAAHSHRDGRRFWNLRTPDRYIDAVRSRASVEAAGEQLAADERSLEALQLAIRTRDGVPRTSFTDDDLHELGELLAPVDADGDRVALTVPGRLLANEVALRLRVPPTPPN